MLLGKAEDAIASGATGTVGVWKGVPGSESDTGRDIEAFNGTGVAIDAGAWVLLLNFGFGWYAEPWECPA